MNDFFYIVHIETIIPMIFGGLVTGVTLFNFFKLRLTHVYVILLLALIYAVIGVTTRYFEGAEWARFLGTVFLFYVFIGSAVLGHNISRKIKIPPYFNK
jgi:hypothetical protein